MWSCSAKTNKKKKKLATEDKAESGYVTVSAPTTDDEG
jgi:hypothetical protein